MRKKLAEKDIRYCVRCGILEETVKQEGSTGCWIMGGGKVAERHSYITDRELEKR